MLWLGNNSRRTALPPCESFATRYPPNFATFSAFFSNNPALPCQEDTGAEKTSGPERHRNRKDAEESETRGASGPPLWRTITLSSPHVHDFARGGSAKTRTCACAWRIRGNACAHLHAGAHLGHNVSALHETLSRFFLRIASQRSRRRRAGSGQDRRLNPGKRLASSAMHTAGAGATKAENRRRKRNTTDRRIDLPRSHTATLSERAARSREVLAALRRRARGVCACRSLPP